jgi:hypothetical protein
LDAFFVISNPLREVNRGRAFLTVAEEEAGGGEGNPGPIPFVAADL